MYVSAIQLLRIRSLLLPALTCLVVTLVEIPAVASGVPDVSFNRIKPPSACLIWIAPEVSILALTLATFAPLISLASVVSVVPLSVTVTALLSVTLFAVLA